MRPVVFVSRVFVTGTNICINVRRVYLCVWFPPHRFVQLSGHVCPEDALHDQSGSLLAFVARSLDIHALVLLNDDRSTCASQELCKTVGKKEQHRGYYLCTSTFSLKNSTECNNWVPEIKKIPFIFSAGKLIF